MWVNFSGEFDGEKQGLSLTGQIIQWLSVRGERECHLVRRPGELIHP
jgi:hypothetical protein